MYSPYCHIWSFSNWGKSCLLGPGKENHKFDWLKFYWDWLLINMVLNKLKVQSRSRKKKEEQWRQVGGQRWMASSELCSCKVLIPVRFSSSQEEKTYCHRVIHKENSMEKVKATLVDVGRKRKAKWYNTIGLWTGGSPLLSSLSNVALRKTFPGILVSESTGELFRCNWNLSQTFAIKRWPDSERKWLKPISGKWTLFLDQLLWMRWWRGGCIQLLKVLFLQHAQMRTQPARLWVWAALMVPSTICRRWDNWFQLPLALPPLFFLLWLGISTSSRFRKGDLGTELDETTC